MATCHCACICVLEFIVQLGSSGEFILAIYHIIPSIVPAKLSCDRTADRRPLCAGRRLIVPFITLLADCVRLFFIGFITFMPRRLQFRCGNTGMNAYDK
jgi:hypothetical protein